jgi:hypothetical protein
MNLTVTLRIEPLPSSGHPSTTATPTPPDLAITLPPISNWLPIVIQILQWIQSISGNA